MPDLEHLAELARRVRPTDGSIASALATECGHTLESLGLFAAPKAVASTAPGGPPPRPFPPIEFLVDSILLAAGEAAAAAAGGHARLNSAPRSRAPAASV
jgi:hypothetical protein